MPVRAPFFQFQSHKLVYGDYSVTGRICQWVAKNKSYKTTSLVLYNSRHITYNGKNIIKKRDEGMSTPICGRTESLYLLREDRFRNMIPEQRGGRKLCGSRRRRSAPAGGIQPPVQCSEIHRRRRAYPDHVEEYAEVRHPDRGRQRHR